MGRQANGDERRAGWTSRQGERIGLSRRSARLCRRISRGRRAILENVHVRFGEIRNPPAQPTASRAEGVGEGGTGHAPASPAEIHRKFEWPSRPPWAAILLPAPGAAARDIG